jgi:hypothetical protein
VTSPADYVTLAEATRQLGIDEATVQGWVEAGLVRRELIRSQWRYALPDLLALAGKPVPQPRPELPATREDVRPAPEGAALSRDQVATVQVERDEARRELGRLRKEHKESLVQIQQLQAELERTRKALRQQEQQLQGQLTTVNRDREQLVRSGQQTASTLEATRTQLREQERRLALLHEDMRVEKLRADKLLELLTAAKTELDGHLHPRNVRTWWASIRRIRRPWHVTLLLLLVLFSVLGIEGLQVQQLFRLAWERDQALSREATARVATAPPANTMLPCGQVTRPGVRMRRSPSLDSPVLIARVELSARFPIGTFLDTTDGITWLEVTLEGQRGWISQEYVQRVPC